jgi:hypothetical protein
MNTTKTKGDRTEDEAKGEDPEIKVMKKNMTDRQGK